MTHTNLPGISDSATASALACSARESSRFPSALPCPALTTAPSTSTRKPAGLVTSGSSHGSNALVVPATAPWLSLPPPDGSPLPTDRPPTPAELWPLLALKEAVRPSSQTGLLRLGGPPPAAVPAVDSPDQLSPVPARPAPEPSPTPLGRGVWFVQPPSPADVAVEARAPAAVPPAAAAAATAIARALSSWKQAPTIRRSDGSVGG